MPNFQYQAVDKSGQTVRGTLDASNEVDLELRLKRMGLDLVTLRLSDPRLAPFARSKISRQDLITFCFHMEQISRAGISFLEGLKDLRDSMDNPRFREIITALLEDLEGGKMLSQALSAFPAVFDHVFVSLVRAGEQTGTLEHVFENLADTLKWQDEIAAQTRRLLVYPSIVLVVVGAVISVLIMVVVPQVVGLLRNMGVALPLQTRLLISLSDFLIRFWPLVIGLPLAAAAAFGIMVKRSEKTALMWDQMKLRLPFVGVILQKIILARFANFFALMYRSGISILDALRTCEDIVANRAIATGLQRAEQRISAGDGLTESFHNLGLFPPLVIRMLKVGETTGALDVALLNVSYFYNREVKDAIDKSLKLLEPALTVILGLAMAAIMFSVLMPVYDVLGNLKL